MLPITVTTEEESARCLIRSVLVKFTGKWQILILLALDDEPLRFGQLRREIGDITQRVLTDNLRNLERDGFLSRTVDGGPPVSVSYALTPMGKSLVDTLIPLIDWTRNRFQEVQNARTAYDSL